VGLAKKCRANDSLTTATRCKPAANPVKRSQIFSLPVDSEQTLHYLPIRAYTEAIHLFAQTAL
jgi:hypothetical protein